MGKPKPADNGRNPPGRERGRPTVVHSISRKLDLLSKLLKARRESKRAKDLFDSKQYQNWNSNGTWTRHKPKKYWEWRYRITPYRAKLTSPQQSGGHLSAKLIQLIIRYIINVQTRQQEQHAGHPEPDRGRAVIGQKSETTQRPPGCKVRKRINLIKRYKEAFATTRPRDADLRKNP